MSIQAGLAFVEFSVRGRETVQRAFVEVQRRLVAFSAMARRLGGYSFNQLNAGLASAKARLTSLVRTGTKGLVSGLSSVATRLVDISKYAAVAGGALAGVLIGDSIKKASDLEETLNKFNVVFGDQAGAMRQWGETMATQLGRSKKQTLDFLANAQGLVVPMGIDEAQAREMSLTLTQLSYDLASFHNLADDDAWEKIRSGLTGETEPLKALGVVINETAVKAELAAMGISGKVTEAHKVQARYNLILKGTRDAQGDVDRSSESFANQLKALQGAWDDLSVQIGQLFLPIATLLVASLKDIVNGLSETGVASDQVSDSIGQIGTQGSGLFTVIGYLIKGWAMFNTTIQTGKGLVQSLFATLIALAGFVAKSAVFEQLFGKEEMEAAREGIRVAAETLFKDAEASFNSAGASLDLLDDDPEELGRNLFSGIQARLDEVKAKAAEAGELVRADFAPLENLGPSVTPHVRKIKKQAEELGKVVDMVTPEALESNSTKAFEQFNANRQTQERLAKATEAMLRALENPLIGIAVAQ